MIRVIDGDVDRTAANELPKQNYVLTGDTLYIGKEYPYDNIYFQIVGNQLDSHSFTVHYWDGDEWILPEDQIDETLGLTRSGHVKIIYDPYNTGILWESFSTRIAGLENFKNISDRHWMRITSTQMNQGSVVPFSRTLSRIGYALTDEETMRDIYPRLDDYKTALGLADFSRQIFAATDIAMTKLKAQGQIYSKCNILRAREWYNAVAFGALALIFSAVDSEDSMRSKNYYAKFDKMLTTSGKRIDIFGDAKDDIYNQAPQHRLIR